MAELHSRKSHDYASDENPYGNYEFAGEISCMFSHSPQDAGFAGRMAEKLFRLANLERAGKTPKNESIEDTERDLCVIIALWMSARRNRRKIEQMLRVKSMMDQWSKEDSEIQSPALPFDPENF